MVPVPGPVTVEPLNAGVFAPLTWTQTRMQLPPFARTWLKTELKCALSIVEFGPKSLAKLRHARFRPFRKIFWLLKWMRFVCADAVEAASTHPIKSRADSSAQDLPNR